MRPEERNLRCSFCDEKGQHYSDSCPRYRYVETRKKRIRCVKCLDTDHSKEQCGRSVRNCVYCKDDSHNKALCTLPETIEQNEWELRKLRRELDALEGDM
ncbi:hypothetical protein OSTOST_24225, partial [Ostertagia ostertagi]